MSLHNVFEAVFRPNALIADMATGEMGITDEDQLLPYGRSRNKGDGEAVQSLGSVSTIDSNTTATLSLHVNCGKYLFKCKPADRNMAASGP